MGGVGSVGQNVKEDRRWTSLGREVGERPEEGGDRNGNIKQNLG